MKIVPAFSRWLLTLPLVAYVSAGAVPQAGSAESRTDPAAVAAELDRKLATELHAETDTKPAPRADDETYLRRVFLDLIGRPPTPDDVVVFLLDSDPNKRTNVVRQLLADDEYGEHWASYWRDTIMYRRSEQRAVLAIGALTQFLTEQLNNNTPWNEVARSFITASGDVTEDGATALIMAQAGQPEDTVAEISRIFLGIQIQCAQCHDHPTDRWKREQFHQLAAFFPRVAARPTRDGQQRSFVVVANDQQRFFGGNNNNNRYRGTPEHYMPDLDDPSSRGTLMKPVLFLTGDALPLGSRDAERRESLADWITAQDNEWFAKAFVNRMWSELVGEGFSEPVDDLGPDRESVAPQSFQYLASQFAEHGYDVKWLVETIMATEAYQREVRSRRGLDEAPYLANCSQRLRADQLYRSLATVLGFEARQAPRRGPYAALAGPEAAFQQVFGFDPSERRDEISGSIPQALLLMNSPTINNAVSAQRANGLGGMLRDIPKDRDLVVELYLRTLSRQPRESEVKTCLDYVRQVDNRAEAFEDIWWSLLNSTEFLNRN